VAYQAIECYAVIGDMRAGALVGTDVLQSAVAVAYCGRPVGR
jgi:hypothetical protein